MNQAQETSPGKLRRFLRRLPEDRALILRAMLVLPLTGTGLRIFGFRRCKAWIEQFPIHESSPCAGEQDVQLAFAERAVRAIRSAELHGLATPNCLERSLVLWWLLRRHGIRGELRIGARKSGMLLEAHAWVELAGKVLNDHNEVDKHYSRFDAPIAVAEGFTTRHER